MKKLIFILISLPFFHLLYSQNITHSFMQGNNINAVFSSDGIFNYDRITFLGGEAGFIWPASAQSRLTSVYISGFWIGAKVGAQRELRLAAAFFGSHFSPGNIPEIGQIPPSSVCNDPSWRGYLVNLNDPTLLNGGIRTKIAGGRTYTFIYDSWANWPVQKGAPYVEINGIPGYQPSWNGDRPGIGNNMNARPEEILFMVFMDYTNCSNNIHQSQLSLPGGTLPLGAEIHKLVFNFSCTELKDMYFIKYKIINKSSFVWDSIYVSNINDYDIGYAFDDGVGCDTLRNLAFAYNQSNNDLIYGINPPSIGTRILQSPLIYTGLNSDTAKLPYDTLIGYKMTQMSGFIKLINSSNQCFTDPDNAIFAYNFMRGKDGCGNNIINKVTGNPTTFMYSGNACNRIGWYDSSSGDIRSISNIGPFKMLSGDTQIVVLNYMITRDGGNNFFNVCALQSLSDSALKYYYNDFKTCIPLKIEPLSSDIPSHYSLYQNFPNPFNPVTKIKFDIASTGLNNVKLIVYDMLGNEITTLIDEKLQAGKYEIQWDASVYPSGVYFCKLITDKFTQVNKMVLLK
jgi:hypothetical protein